MKTALLLMLLSQGTDVTTSLVAFHQGAHEANPLVISEQPAPFIAQAVALGAAEVWALKKLSKKHPKLAKSLSYVGFSAHVGASVNNGIVIKQQH